MGAIGGKGRYEEFGAPPWAGIVLALIVALSLMGPLAHARATPAHAQPLASTIHGAAQHKR